MVNKTYPDLPSPNIDVGGLNFHGPKEFLVVGDLEALPDIILETIFGTAGLTAQDTEQAFRGEHEHV
jgi:hypothetical protein